MEIWKPTCIFGDIYQVSNYGRVKSLTKRIATRGGATRTIQEKILSPYDRHGYRMVTLSRKAERKYIFVHRLVAFAFIENTENKPFCNHINGIKSDNRVENIEWCTTSENATHAYKTGLRKSSTGFGEKCPRAKLTEAQVISIRSSIKDGESVPAIAAQYGLSRHTIYAIKSGRTWPHILPS